MRNETRLAYNAYVEQLQRLNGVPDATTRFTVTPTIQQKLETKLQDSTAFLGKINMIGVVEQSGAKVGLGISSPIASRTDTSTGTRRTTRDPSGLMQTTYTCSKTNYDTHIKYAKLDAWAKFPDFQTRIRDSIVTRQALDRIMVGFNGTSIAPTTSLANNPLLQDVNKGWLQHMREDAPARVMNKGAGNGAIIVGTAAGADYINLDALVYDAVELLDPWAQEDVELVAICGRKLLHDKYFPLINADQTNNATQVLATDIVVSQKRIGGLPAVRVPYFPDNSVLITRYDNLSLYWQEGGRRRLVKDCPELDQVENFESSNDAYVIEDYGFAALVENIQLPAGQPTLGDVEGAAAFAAEQQQVAPAPGD